MRVALPFKIQPGAAVDATNLHEAIIGPISRMCLEALNAAATTQGPNRELVVANVHEQIKTHERVDNYRMKNFGTSAFEGKTPALSQLPTFIKANLCTVGGEMTHLFTDKTFKDGSSAASLAILLHLKKAAAHPPTEGAAGAPRPVEMVMRATAWIGGVPYALEDIMRAYMPKVGRLGSSSCLTAGGA
jgi:hypothetical protein